MADQYRIIGIYHNRSPAGSVSVNLMPIGDARPVGCVLLGVGDFGFYRGPRYPVEIVEGPDENGYVKLREAEGPLL